jgi:RimJ/RimL family protein N-acetyltransferase
MSGSLLLPLRTARLELRALSRADLDDHHSMYRDPEVVRYLYERPIDREEASVHLSGRLSAHLPDEGAWLNLAAAADGRYLGEVGVSLVSRDHRQCEVGYVFLPQAQGAGYATEAVAAMVDLAFEQLDAHRVAGRLDGRNGASARLLERLGMRREAHLRANEWVKGEWTDEMIYAITESEWRAARPATVS